MFFELHSDKPTQNILDSCAVHFSVPYTHPKVEGLKNWKGSSLYEKCSAAEPKGIPSEVRILVKDGIFPCSFSTAVYVWRGRIRQVMCKVVDEWNRISVRNSLRV